MLLDIMIHCIFILIYTMLHCILILQDIIINYVTNLMKTQDSHTNNSTSKFHIVFYQNRVV